MWVTSKEYRPMTFGMIYNYTIWLINHNSNNHKNNSLNSTIITFHTILKYIKMMEQSSDFASIILTIYRILFYKKEWYLIINLNIQINHKENKIFNKIYKCLHHNSTFKNNISAVFLFTNYIMLQVSKLLFIIFNILKSQLMNGNNKLICTRK
jgi:hypothetical protein